MREAQTLSDLSTNDECHREGRSSLRVQCPEDRVVIAMKTTTRLASRQSLPVQLPDRDPLVCAEPRVQRLARPTPRARAGSSWTHRCRDQAWGVLGR